MSFRVRNHSRRPRSYVLTASPMHAENGLPAPAVTIAPSAITLVPGELATVRVSVDASRQAPGTTAATRIEVAAECCETQILCVSVTVRRHEEEGPVIDLDCCCRPRRCDPPAPPHQGPADPVKYPNGSHPS
jgi:hypothetical protein